ncbi:MAG: MoaD/ThiS family protein [Saprospirales bacterium]|nr:MoaD/ThiS family protein [Saprospirales bacterium]
MKLTILAFGITRDILGTSELNLELPESARIEDLKAELARRFPAFANLSALAIAVNSQYAELDLELKELDEVALIPPVSGG